jgi:hypothetical protein
MDHGFFKISDVLRFQAVRIHRGVRTRTRSFFWAWPLATTATTATTTALGNSVASRCGFPATRLLVHALVSGAAISRLGMKMDDTSFKGL